MKLIYDNNVILIKRSLEKIMAFYYFYVSHGMTELFYNNINEFTILNLLVHEKVIVDKTQSIEKGKPIYKFIHTEEYIENNDEFIIDCRKKLEDIKLDKDYIEKIIKHVEKLKEKKQEIDKSKQVENIWLEINKELENKIDIKEIDNCLGFTNN